MRMPIICIYIFILISTVNAEPAPHTTYHLNDGSYLHISDNDTMTMVDKEGNPIKMRDGMEMVLKDGSRIMMKNNKIWRYFHRRSKK